MPLFGPPNVDRLKARGDDLGLIKALEYQKNWRVRRDAAVALGQIGDASAVAPLMSALKSPAVDVRKSAAEALGQIGDRGAAEPLIAALKDASWSVRRAAADALGQIRDPSAIEGLRAALEDHDSNVRRAATDALGALGWQPGRAKSGSQSGRATATFRQQ